MNFKINEKTLGIVKEALVKALDHTDYNSMCFSSSDIRIARAFNNDIRMVFNILKDNGINIIKDSDEEFRNRFTGYYNEDDFKDIVTPDTFEFILYSNAIWRISTDLFALKCSTNNFLIVEEEHFTKYWSAITNGCAYRIAPTKEALLEFSTFSSSLQKSLDFILEEIENATINNIRAVYFDKDEVELEILYTKEAKNYSLYLYETGARADVTLSSEGIALKIYPIDKDNKAYRTLYDLDFVHYYDELDSQHTKLSSKAESLFKEKLKVIEQSHTKFRDADSSTIEGGLYRYWEYSSELDLKNKEMDDCLRESDGCDSCLEYDIENLSNICADIYHSVKEKLLESIAPENFINSYNKARKKNCYMLDEDCLVENSSYIEYVFSNLEKEINSSVA